MANPGCFFGDLIKQTEWIEKHVGSKGHVHGCALSPAMRVVIFDNKPQGGLLVMGVTAEIAQYSPTNIQTLAVSLGNAKDGGMAVGVEVTKKASKDCLCGCGRSIAYLRAENHADMLCQILTITAGMMQAMQHAQQSMVLTPDMPKMPPLQA